MFIILLLFLLLQLVAHVSRWGQQFLSTSVLSVVRYSADDFSDEPNINILYQFNIVNWNIFLGGGPLPGGPLPEDLFRERASTPIYDIIQPPPCRSSTWSVAFHHPQQHSLYQFVVIHSADVTEKLEFPLLYQVHHCAVSLYFFSKGLVTDFDFPADV